MDLDCATNRKCCQCPAALDPMWAAQNTHNPHRPFRPLPCLKDIKIKYLINFIFKKCDRFEVGRTPFWCPNHKCVVHCIWPPMDSAPCRRQSI